MLKITGRQDVGGIVGEVGDTDGTNDTKNAVKNCTNYATLNFSSEYTGGIIGTARKDVDIFNCRNEANLTLGGRSGGIIGYPMGETNIINCSNIGEIRGTNQLGGIVGWATGTEEVSIFNCFNIGNVIGTSWNVGGIFGQGAAILNNCYNTGIVTGESTFGQFGGQMNGSKISNCYTRLGSNETIWGSKYESDVFGITSMSIDDMKTENFKNTLNSNRLLQDVWYEWLWNANANNGLPYLKE